MPSTNSVLLMAVAALATSVSASPSTGSPYMKFFKRADSWGPAVSTGPAAHEIISSVTTTYPGAYPPNQQGGLFLWPGMSNGTGDLIQAVVGGYRSGQSECAGANANSQWCVSAEVFGDISPGRPNQWVGDLRTLLASPSDGVTIAYDLTDKTKYTWKQTVTNAKTGASMAAFTKNSGPMLGWGTAVECQSCTPTIAEQTYVNTKIVLAQADPNWPRVVGASQGATYTTPQTTDGGKTWTIAKIVIPAMKKS